MGWIKIRLSVTGHGTGFLHLWKHKKSTKKYVNLNLTLKIIISGEFSVYFKTVLHSTAAVKSITADAPYRRHQDKDKWKAESVARQSKCSATSSEVCRIKPSCVFFHVSLGGAHLTLPRTAFSLRSNTSGLPGRNEQIQGHMILDINDLHPYCLFLHQTWLLGNLFQNLGGMLHAGSYF